MLIDLYTLLISKCWVTQLEFLRRTEASTTHKGATQYAETSYRTRHRRGRNWTSRRISKDRCDGARCASSLTASTKATLKPSRPLALTKLSSSTIFHLTSGADQE